MLTRVEARFFLGGQPQAPAHFGHLRNLVIDVVSQRDTVCKGKRQSDDLL